MGARLDLRAGWTDLERGVVHRQGETIQLSRVEHRLLLHLIARDGARVTREQLLIDVWGYRPGVVSRTVFSTVDRLRRKIEVDPRKPDHLLTEPLGGYRLVPLPATAAPTQAVGRDDLLATLEGRRVTLLTGPPGIGATTVAAAFAARQRSAREVVWVGLDGTSSPEVALRQALGIDAEVEVREVLAARAPLLLVLDGLTDEDGDLRALTWDVDGVHVLGTSSTALPGWDPLPVPPLAPADACALLRDRLAAEGRSLPAGLTPDGRDWAEALCSAAGHIPLAVLQIAGMLQRLGPADLLDRPDRLVAQGPGLRASLTLGWELLGPADRQALARLAVAPASFPVGAAEALLAEDPGALGRLVASAWLHVEAGISARYTVLAPVRAFVRELGMRASDAPLHAWAVARVRAGLERLDGPEGRAAAEELRADLPLITGLIEARGPASCPELLDVLAPVLVRLGLDPRLAGWLSAAGTPALAVRLGEVLTCAGRDGRAVLQDATEALRGQGPLEARAWIELAVALRSGGDPGASAEALDRAEALAHALDHLPTRARCALERGMTLRAAGDLPGAWRQGEEAVALARHAGNLRIEAGALGLLGTLARRDGRDGLAEGMLREAVLGSEHVGDPNNAAHARSNLANVMIGLERWDEAEELLQECLAGYRRQGYRHSEGYVHLGLAHVALGRGDLTACVREATASRLAFRTSRNPVGVAHASLLLGRLAHAAGDRAAAVGFYEDASAELPAWGAPRVLAGLCRGTSLDALGTSFPDDPVLTAARAAPDLDRWVRGLATRDPDRSFLRS